MSERPNSRRTLRERSLFIGGHPFSITVRVACPSCSGAMDETEKVLTRGFLRCVSNLKGAGSHRSFERTEGGRWTMALMEI